MMPAEIPLALVDSGISGAPQAWNITESLQLPIWPTATGGTR